MIDFGLEARSLPIEESDDIECSAEATSLGALTEPLSSADALGDNVFITDLAPGTCFARADPDDANEASNLMKSLCREHVEALTGPTMLLHGVGRGFSSLGGLGGLGEELESDIEWYASLKIEDGFMAVISHVGPDAVLSGEARFSCVRRTCWLG